MSDTSVIYRYPTSQLLLGFGFTIAGALVFLAFTIALPLMAFVWPKMIEGNRWYLVPVEIPGVALVVMSAITIPSIYRRKRPIAIGVSNIMSLGFWGEARIELSWDRVNKIGREFLYDSFSCKNGYQYEIHGDGKIIRFDDSIQDSDALIQALNAQMVAHNIPASSTERGPDVCEGVVDPVERRQLAKHGRTSPVTSF